MQITDASGKSHTICDFCGKHELWAKDMVAAPLVAICNDCIDLAAEIVKEERAKKSAPAPEPATLDEVVAMLRRAANTLKRAPGVMDSQISDIDGVLSRCPMA